MKFFAFAVSLLLSWSLQGQVNATVRASESAEYQAYTLVVTSLEAFKTWASAQQVVLTGTYRPANIVVLETTPQVLREKIIPNPLVSYVMASSLHPLEELIVPGQNLFVNKINVAQALYPSLNGAGSLVSIKEFRFDSLDVDLLNRVRSSPDALSEVTSHASVMVSLTAGAGNADPAGRGAAPGCDVLSTSYGLLLPDTTYAAQGISVQNHSYGVDIENVYGPNALAYDQSALENPSLLHVFSAGNSGGFAAPFGQYANVPGFANLTGNFKMAKNVLTIGAVDSMGERTFFSSRGPAYDGRVKPDLLAYGQDGTSGAAASVSGAAAVLQQALREQTGSEPGSDLLRAVLINSADDRGAPGPDFDNGFGNMNLKNALKIVSGQQFFAATFDAQDVLNLPLNIPANARNLKITLSWNDLPAQAGAVKALVNDLDLQLFGENGASWLPWVLQVQPNADSLRLPAQRGLDTLNNVEQITLDAPAAGQYIIRVSARELLSAGQSFALAYDWDLEGKFEWTYPLQNDPAVAAREVLLGWESNLPELTGRLEWKTVSGLQWQLIDAEANLQAGIRRWLMPDTFAEAQVRMQVGAQNFSSDTFLIAPELRIGIGFNCPDSVGIFWNPAGDGAAYQLYGLGQRYLEPLMVTADTFLSLDKQTFPQQRFAVAPLGPNHAALGKRSAAPDIGQQGVTCYQKSFIAELNGSKQVDITLLLGTLYGLEKVLFEKWNGQQYVLLKTFEPVESEMFTHQDLQLQRGKNSYRASLYTSGGNIIRSDTASVYFAGEQGWLLFPNPVTQGRTIQVLSESSGEAIFRLFDALGRIVLSQKLEADLVSINLPNLPPGFYFFDALENGRRKWSGVVLLH